VQNPDASPAVQQTRLARTLLIGATVLWGLSFPLQRGLELAQEACGAHVSDVTLAYADTAMRFGLAALLLLPLNARALPTITKLEWGQAFGLAVFAGCGLFLQTLGLEWTDASVTAFLTQLYTLLVPLIVALRDWRLPSLRVVLACALVLMGIVVLSPHLVAHMILGPGEIVILLSTLFFACQIVWVERPIYEANRSGLVTLIMFSLLTGMYLAGFFSTGGTVHAAGRLFGTPPLWILILGMVVFCTLSNFYIMNTWQRFVSATEAGLIYCIEPVMATALSSVLPGAISALVGIRYENETLTWSVLIGGVLIVLATVLVATEKRKERD
jgi:drug/metabolite transporter (DMT)-like permease